MEDVILSLQYHVPWLDVLVAILIFTHLLLHLALYCVVKATPASICVMNYIDNRSCVVWSRQSALRISLWLSLFVLFVTYDAYLTVCLVGILIIPYTVCYRVGKNITMSMGEDSARRIMDVDAITWQHTL